MKKRLLFKIFDHVKWISDIPAGLPEAFSVFHQCHFSRHEEFASRMELMAWNLSLMRLLASKQT